MDERHGREITWTRKVKRATGEFTLKNMREHIIPDGYVNAPGDRAPEKAAPYLPRRNP